MKKILFYNAVGGGVIAKTILSGCYKFGAATLLRRNGATMTSVIEYEDKQIVQYLRLHGWQLCRECVRNRRSEPHHQYNGGGKS